MRTKKLRLVSALLALAMLFVMMPVGAFADNPSSTEGYCGATENDDVHWKYDSGVLTFSGTGAMADYENFNGVPWSNWQHSITKVVINDGVTRISKGAFYYCSELLNVKLSQNLTDIGDSAFEGCSALKNVEIPAGVKTIGAQAFLGCEKLSNVIIPSGVTTIGAGTFQSCTGLTSIGIPSSVTNIGEYAFYRCTGLSSITIPSSVTTIGDGAFESCAQLKIYCGAPLKKSGLLSDKGVAEENIIASVTVKLVDGEKTETRNVPYGGTVGTLEQPTKEGYTFVGWYGENGEVFDPAAPLTEDTTIHAEWKKNAAPAPTPTPAPAPAPVDDDSVDAGAVAATVVLGAGGAVLAYHIGTELYAEQVLGKGVVVPTLRGDVARKAWELAGKPAVTVAGNEAPDEDAQAQQWVVDQGLMKDRKDGKFHPEQWMSKLKALRTLDAAKKLG